MTNTATAKRPEALPNADPAAAARALAEHWRQRAAEIGEQMATTQARLETLETEAARAALEGEPLPDMGGLETELRALKRGLMPESAE